jgi:two-component system NtrC family sensor kinase
VIGSAEFPEGRALDSEKKPIRVLLVDDEASLLTVAKQVLGAKGAFKVDTALSVEDAMEKLKRETYDAIVSDYRMPKKDGLEFLAELRQEGNTIPFIILTGKGMEEVAVHALNLGADHYVNKSVSPEIMFSELAHGIMKAAERRRAQMVAWLRQERLDAIFDSSPNAITIIDLEGNVVECNQETLRLMNSSSKREIVGKSFLEFVAERDRLRMKENLKKVLEHGAVKDIEFALLTKYGAGLVGEISASVVKDFSGNPTGLVLIINDVTVRKRAENRLRQYSKRLEANRRFLEDIFAAFPDPVTVCDLDRNVIKCNQATLDLYGYISKNEMIGTNLCALLSQGDREKAIAELEKVKALGSVRNVECAMVGRKGNEFPTELSAGAIMDSSGNSLGLVVITKNIAERKRLQEQLLVSEKLVAVGQWAAGFSHDIRNPLAVIKNSVCFLRMRLKEVSDEKVLRHLAILEEEIKYADLMVNNLLDFTRNNPPRLQEANVNETVRSALSSVSIPENVKLVLRLGEIPLMLADEVQLQRVFTNVILNAVQAMPSGGRLTVMTLKDHDIAEITFSDTGVGISEENIRKMFTPLFSTKTNGVGLGLSICRQIIEAHGGKINARSREGKGTAFTIKLPIRAKELQDRSASTILGDYMEVSQHERKTESTDN